MKYRVWLVLASALMLLAGLAARVNPGHWPVSRESTTPVPMDNVTVFAFSQVNPGEADPQVLDLAPDISISGWQRWDRDGTRAGDYNTSFVKSCQAAGVRFIGGTTASVLFRDEAASDAEFLDWATRDAAGSLTPRSSFHPPAYRASLANPSYREYLIGIGKLQIDAGVDGLFFDELNGDYQGVAYDNNEGFDDYHLADFSAFLISNLPPGADLRSRYGWNPAYQTPRPQRPGQPQPAFNYRAYLAEHDWSATPFAPANPLAAEWGRSTGNHPPANAANFVDQAEPYLYFRPIAMALRAYARQKYGRSLLLTSNGIWPFTDFQSVGLYDYNSYGPGDSNTDFCPLTSDGHLNGSVSLQSTLVNIRNLSAQTAPGALVALFIDWPTPLLDRYNALPLSEREDYWRMYAAEAYANGLFFAFHLRTTTGEPTATQAGVMALFKSLAEFYRAHASLYHAVVPSAASASVTVPGAMIAITDQASPNRRIVHIVNHQYDGAFIAQSNVVLTVDAAAAPTAVNLASPDLAKDEAVPFSWAAGKLTVTLPSLIAYDIVTVSW